MRLACRVGRHEAGVGEIWNDGLFFSFCRGCGCDLVRKPGVAWRTVRSPMKVVWRPRQPSDMAWIARTSVLPPDDKLPVAPEWRQMIARERDRRAAARAALHYQADAP